MKRLTLLGYRPIAWCCGVAMAVVVGLCAPQHALAQAEAPAGSKNENFSAKPPAQLFASDCTGAGCHKAPQGLAKGQSQGSLAGFLREHYTNSRESAAALAGYLAKLPSGPEPKEREVRTPRPSRPAAAEPGPSLPRWGGFGASEPAEPKPAAKPKPEPEPKETRAPRQHPAARTSRAAARPDEEPPAAAPAKPAPAARAQRGRQPTAAVPMPPPAPEPAAAPPPAPPPPKQYDIFD